MFGVFDEGGSTMSVVIRTATADARLRGKSAGYAGQPNNPPHKNQALRAAWQIGWEQGRKQRQDSEVR